MENRTESCNDQQLHTNLLDIISKYRHDYMNDLQVLFGYIRLRKEDKVLEYADRIREKLIRESRLSKWSNPSFVFDLLVYQTKQNKFELNVVLSDEVDRFKGTNSVDEAERRMRDVLHLYEQCARDNIGEANQLVLTVDALDDQLLLSFEYTGTLDDSAFQYGLTVLEERWGEGDRSSVEWHCEDEAADVEIRISLSA